MALIKYTECGQMVSDKAKTCPHCGATVVKESITPAQQTTVQQSQTEQRQPEPQQQLEKQENNKKPIIILLSIALIAIVVGIGLYFLLKGNANTNKGGEGIESDKEVKQENAVASHKEPPNTINGHEYVDLGLSVVWATCNVGASSPEDYGDYYAWGETKTKSEYTSKNSATWEKNMGDIAGNPNYDAARANWGGSWRLPTVYECQELAENCTTESTTRNGVNGKLVTSKKNGNSIFLPAAGIRGGSWNATGVLGNYWSSSPEDDESNAWAYELGFGSDIDLGWDGSNFRFEGQSVRPVSDGTTISKKQPQSTNTKIAIKGNTQKDTQLTKIVSPPSNGYIINGHEYVDLGLSVKWATCNVGASSPEGYGNYYAWGETRTKSEYTTNNCTTYNKNIGDIAGKPNYDVARANWGGTWRLPTLYEIDELINNCTTEWTTRNGVKGRLVKSKKNGNSIFLPAAGDHDGPSLYYARVYGTYWVSSPREIGLQDAYSLFFNNEKFYWDWSRRRYGRSVRAVTE